MKKNLLFCSGLVSLLIFSSCVYAEGEPEWVTHTVFPVSLFRNYVDIAAQNSSIPKVVKVTSTEPEFQIDKGYVIVGSDSASTPISGYLKKVSNFSPERILSATYPEVTDGDSTTFAKIPFDKASPTHFVKIKFWSKDSITSDMISIVLDRYVSSPDRVSLSAATSRGEEVVVADKPLSDLTFHFPQTQAREWDLMLTYTQPLRISEIYFNQKDTTSSETHLLFLRQPEVSYRIYFNPEKEQGMTSNYQLASATNIDTVRLLHSDIVQNYSFLQSDQDGDKVLDTVDNCPTVANPDQSDIDKDGKGDMCSDNDYDGVINSQDNCPNISNPDQQDTDGDHIGNVCDSSENRFTEKYPWLPWVGIGSAGAVLVLLFALTAKGLQKKKKIK